MTKFKIIIPFYNLVIGDGISRLETNILVPESITKKVIIPYGLKKVKTQIL